MFRKLYNQAVLKARLLPAGPVLIVQGGVSLDPGAPDLAFVRTLRDGVPTVYLPGSSLKGVLRAHVERLLATWVGEAAAENPFDFKTPRRQQAQEQRKKGDTAATYRISCATDRLFGSNEVAGRLRIADALPPSQSETQAANQTETRYGIAIDRTTQAVKGKALFEQEAVTGGSFALSLHIENYDLWMLALVLQALTDLHAGLVQIGHAKSRGFGTVTLDRPEISLRWPGRDPGQIAGAGACERSPDVRRRYGLSDDDRTDRPAGCETLTEGLFSVARYRGHDAFAGLLQQLGSGEESPLQRFVSREVRHGV